MSTRDGSRAPLAQPDLLRREGDPAVAGPQLSGDDHVHRLTEELDLGPDLDPVLPDGQLPALEAVGQQPVDLGLGQLDGPVGPVDGDPAGLAQHDVARHPDAVEGERELGGVDPPGAGVGGGDVDGREPPRGKVGKNGKSRTWTTGRWPRSYSRWSASVTRPSKTRAAAKSATAPSRSSTTTAIRSLRIRRPRRTGAAGPARRRREPGRPGRASARRPPAHWSSRARPRTGRRSVRRARPGSSGAGPPAPPPRARRPLRAGRRTVGS